MLCAACLTIFDTLDLLGGRTVRCFNTWCCSKKRSGKESWKVPPQRPPDPQFFGSSQSGQVGDLICIMRVTHRTYLGAFMTHCGGLSSIVPAGHPLKCLLTCWALERVAPDSQTRSIDGFNFLDVPKSEVFSPEANASSSVSFEQSRPLFCNIRPRKQPNI